MIKKKRIFSPLFVVFLAVAGIFSISSYVSNKQTEDSKVDEKVEAATMNAPSTEIRYFDWAGDRQGAKFTNKDDVYKYPLIFMDQFSINSDCVLSSTDYQGIADSGCFDSNGVWKGNLNDGVYAKMKYYNDYGYTVSLPWFIDSCRIQLRRQENNNPEFRYLCLQGNNVWSYTISRKHIYEFTTGDATTPTEYKCYYSGDKYRVGYMTESDQGDKNYQHSVDYYTVTFNLNNGESNTTSNVFKKGKVSPLKSNPKKDHYSFRRWLKSSTEYNFNNEVTQNFTLTADYYNPSQTMRLWLWRSTHYVASGQEWRITNNVIKGTFAPNYIQINSNSSIYLAYYDLPTSIGTIQFQIYQDNNYLNNPVSSFSYVDGTNAYMWVVNLVNNKLQIETTWDVWSMRNAGTDWKIDTSMLQTIFGAYFTCSDDPNNGYAYIDRLYNTWVYGTGGSYVHGETTQEGANAVLASTTINDYNYNAGNYDYTSTTGRTVSTGLYFKYQTMLNMKTNGRVRAVNDITPFVYSSNNELSGPVILVIIASSISLISITALSILVIKKRKSK